MVNRLRLKIPGKIVINGSYIVLRGETATCVTIDRYLDVCSSYEDSEDCSIVVNIKDRERLTCFYKDTFVCDSSTSKSYYIFRLIESFFHLTRITPSNNIVIHMNFERDFFINQSVKTGIGSSACIVVGIVISLLYFNEGNYLENLGQIDFMEAPTLENEGIRSIFKDLRLRSETLGSLIKLVYSINKMTNQMSSGVDVISCLIGSIQFNSRIIHKIKGIGKYLMLGTFGKCSSTRSIINKVNLHEKKWDQIIELNNKIYTCPGKESYNEYLDHLFRLNNFTVPKRQYDILKETYKLDIYGCGISGAGGEDAVWCIVDDHTAVHDYWKTVFNYVIVTLIVDNGVVQLDV